MGKASRAKRQRKKVTVTQQALADRVKRSFPDEQIKVVKRKTGRKVSELLMEVADPWLAEARDDRERQIVIGAAVLAWNLSLLPESERWEGKDNEHWDKLGTSSHKVLEEMVERKLELYPEEDRMILDYEVTGSGDKMRVDVMYPLLPREIEELKDTGVTMNRTQTEP